MALIGEDSVLSLVDDHAYYARTNKTRNIYFLNEERLRSILMRDDIRNLPVAVVSVAGAFRGGKSFLLNYFIRYLSAEPSKRADGTWVGAPNQQLTGFGWAPGTKKNTSGILIWPQPFIIQIPSGQQVAVLLMDTQGTFDKESTVRDNSTIFALSTLLSSMQIFNLKHHINESDIMNLELFTKYGIFLKESTGKAFQELKFLVRDWVNYWEFEYGEVGGLRYKENEFEITHITPDQIKKVRQHIDSSFEKVTCFLMPFPGEKVSTPDYKENPEALNSNFMEGLKQLAHSIFSPERLAMKLVAGQPVKSHELFDLFKSYVFIFNSDDLPEPKTICEAQLEVGLMMAVNAARDQFETNMHRECALSMPKEDLLELHNEQVESALVSFNARVIYGDEEDKRTKADELMAELNGRLEDLSSVNNAKTLTAVTNGTTAYVAVMARLSLNQQLCVHANDLLRAHDEGVRAASDAFGQNRRILAPGRTDPDRQRLLSICESKHNKLTQTNEFNNMAYVSEMKNTYHQYMMIVVCNQEPRLGEAALHAQHEIALSRAIEGFESRRNRPNQFPEDVFKHILIQDINFQYENFKLLNQSTNARLLQLALMQYYQGTVSVSELRNSCLHPNDLQALHNRAVTSVLEMFRPGRPPGAGFHLDDPDETILNNLIGNHYATLVTINNTANVSAMEEAFEAYKRKFDELTNYFGYFAASWATARGYHDDAFKVARNVFNNKRRSQAADDDSFLLELENKCELYYNPQGRTTHGFVEFIVGVGEGMEQITRDEYLTLPDD